MDLISCCFFWRFVLNTFDYYLLDLKWIVLLDSYDFFSKFSYWIMFDKYFISATYLIDPISLEFLRRSILNVYKKIKTEALLNGPFMEDLDLLVFIVSSCNLLIQIKLIRRMFLSNNTDLFNTWIHIWETMPPTRGLPGSYAPERLFCQRLSRKVEEKLPKNVNLTE